MKSKTKKVIDILIVKLFVLSHVLMDQSWFLYCVLLSLMFIVVGLNLKHVLAFYFSPLLAFFFLFPHLFSFLISLLFLFFPLIQTQHSWCSVFELRFQCCACVALFVLFLFPEKAVLWTKLWGFNWSVPAWFSLSFLFYFMPWCSVFLQPHSLCVVHCVLRTLKKKKKEKVCCGFQGGKTYFYSFNVKSQQNLFFQHNAFWTTVLKNMSILIFTCYMTCTYL